MAETLKSKYGPEIPKQIAQMIEVVHPTFPAKAFLNDVLAGYEDLELMPRGAHIAACLKNHLPAAFPRAVKILVNSMGPTAAPVEGNGMAPFLYMPHAMFVAKHGLAHFAESMRAQYEITQRFTAEFSIRSFIEQHPDATLKQLKTWATDPSHHVRRLVSEGTRPRLPWASRLREFQRDPRPVLALLELLKDDASLYVRRSVANNLNDIGKDHPALLVEVAARWMEGASREREWIVRHALRSAVKRGDRAALAVLGFGGSNKAQVSNGRVSPVSVKIGGRITLSFLLTNRGRQPLPTVVDYVVYFIKSNGTASPKVFKLKKLVLAPGETAAVTKSLVLKEMTTRKHYPGVHRVGVLINGEEHPVGQFRLSKSSSA